MWQVGSYPESLVIGNGNLYVANSNYGYGGGGIMRTATVALYGAVGRDKPEGETPEGRISDIKDVDMIAADCFNFL